jgi:hypothetical protein
MQKMYAEDKKRIDEMTQEEMCRLWRFSRPGEPLFQDDTGKYFAKVLQEKGGFTPEINKRLGWRTP